jgi:cyclopropane fatty-acyl-phospholipid synthase-like methyltransferase
MSKKYYQTRKSILEYIEMARGYDGRYIISKLKRFLASGSEILEIGSGPGTDWKILNESYTVLGSDNSKEFLRYLTENNPDGDFILLDAVKLSTNLKFDAIYSNKVLHHLTDGELESSVARQSEILKTGGVICHSFWAGEGSETHKGLLVNLQTIKSLKGIFTPGFEIQIIDHYKEFEPDDSIFLIGVKK